MDPATGLFEIIQPNDLVRPESCVNNSQQSEFQQELALAGKSFQASGVTKIILVHGTMVGTDALGWYGHWQRRMPRIAKHLKSEYKRLTDGITGDKGNYTAAYRERLESGINRDTTQKIPVKIFNWSSENHHLGRADAAVRLAEKLLRLGTEHRVMLWGHSHAGNVFAILTNLLGSCSAHDKTSFFSASDCFPDSTGRISKASWKWLASNIHCPPPKLDIATFGTPVRYGWDATACQTLLHFVNHRQLDDVLLGRSKIPTSSSELMTAITGGYGDFVQQVFVAKTDLPPAIWSWSAWNANRRLRKLLERDVSFSDRFEKFQQSTRVHNTGKSFLVDYSRCDETAKLVAGHSIYTELDWMAYHAKMIAKKLQT